MRDLPDSTKTILEGPWLLTAADLEELDQVIQKNWVKLEKRRKKFLNLDVESYRKNFEHLETDQKKTLDKEVKVYKNRSRFSQKHISLRLYYPDSPPYECKSFTEALSELSILKKSPIGFGLDLLSGEIRCQITAYYTNTQLEIEVEPENDEASRELFTTLYEWAGDIRRRELTTLVWGKLAGYRTRILLIGIMLFGLLFFITQYSEADDARKLLTFLYNQGIEESNIVETVRLLASLQMLQPMPSWVGVYILAYFYVALILFVRPKIVLGIGKGKNLIIAWKIWQAIILGIPAVIITIIEVLPYIMDFKIVQTILKFLDIVH